jgi:GNAT superfamily N-acetyltransferase
MLSITLEQDDRVRIAAELRSRIIRFNEARAGAMNREYIVLSLRDSAGELCGGLSGEFFWNALYVDVLWVDEALHRQGHGTHLLEEAERRAIARGCEIAYLSTFSFQAPGFYPKRGYSMIGELTDVPSGAFRRWFAKRLRSHA